MIIINQCFGEFLHFEVGSSSLRIIFNSSRVDLNCSFVIIQCIWIVFQDWVNITSVVIDLSVLANKLYCFGEISQCFLIFFGYIWDFSSNKVRLLIVSIQLYCFTAINCWLKEISWIVAHCCFLQKSFGNSFVNFHGLFTIIERIAIILV